MHVACFDLSAVTALGIPENALLDVAEFYIDASLPAIPGLAACLTKNERMAVLEAATARQFAAFVALHGDPFGCEMEVGKCVAVNDVIISVGLKRDSAKCVN